jgi:pilus assembly protein Flp/PilA
MKEYTLKLFVKAQSLLQSLKEEEGQDLIEYALVAGLIAFGAVAAMKTLASNIGTGFTNVGSKINTYTS